MNAKPVYAIVTPFFPGPDSWRGAYVEDLAAALARTGRWDVRVFTPGAWPDRDVGGVRVHSLSRRALPCELAPYLVDRANVRALFAALDRAGVGRVAVCHAHTVHFAAYAAALRRRDGAFAILHHHFIDPVHLRSGRLGAVPGLANAAYLHWRRLCGEMDAHVFPSRLAADSYARGLRERLWLGRALPPFAPARKRVLYNGVDPRKFSPGRRTPHAGFAIGCVGNFIPGKGQLDLVRAVAEIASADGPAAAPAVRFVGSGPELPKIRAFARAHGLEGRVSFEPERPHAALAEFYRGIDLFVLPSAKEAFGCVYAEALACGVPFVACRSQGIAEVLADDSALVPAHDAGALAAKIRAAMRGEPPAPRLNRTLDVDALVGEFADWLDGAMGGRA